MATEHKSNEISAIPALLQVLQLQGATMTIDAMGDAARDWHGRLKTRIFRVTEDVAWLPRLGQEWAGPARLAMVESHRTVNGQTSIECRYVISSRTCKAQEIAGLIRAHWGIE